MAHYRIARTMPNGWQVRLDMISYDGAFGDTIVPLPEVVLLEMGALTAEFDSLPYGLMNPATFSFRLIWDQLPSGAGSIQEYIEQGYDETSPGIYTRNTWYLYTDRGTSGATWTLEFAGCEDNVEALELQPLDNGFFSYNVELVDIAYYWLKTKSGYDIFNGIGTLVDSEQNAWQIKLVGSGLFEREQLHEFWSINTSAKFINLYDVLDAYADSGGAWNTALSHSTISGNFDYGNNLRKVLTHAVDWFAPANITSLPRNAGSTALTNQELWMIATITPNGQTTPIGGMLVPQDKYGIANANVSAYDVLRELCEQSGVRVGYRFEVSGSGGTTAIRVIFDVKRITEGRDDPSNVDATLSLSSALTYSSITKRGDNILKAEVRYETESDRDATDIVKVQRGARASRSMNIEPLLHNMPVHIQDNNPDDKWPRFKAPIKQTNQLFVRGSYYPAPNGSANNFIKIHEKTRINYSSSQYVEVDPDGLKNPVKATDFKTNSQTQATYFLQINDCQVNGCITAALCNLLLTVFSNENNAIVEVEWPLSISNKVMTDYIAGKFQLTNEAAGKFGNISWDKAMPVSISVDLISAKATHRYYMVSA
jgi:hypothetical protein